jgi:hypothetical protein
VLLSQHVLCHLEVSVTNQDEYKTITTYQASNTFSGLASNNYIYVRSVKDNIALQCRHQQYICLRASSCYSNSLKYNAALVNAIRNDCISTQTGVEYSVNTYQSSNTFSGWLKCYKYVRNLADATCDHVIPDNNNKTVPLPPAVPTASATVQPTCTHHQE